MLSIQKIAPNIRLECSYVQRKEIERELGKGSIDLALDAAILTQGTQLEYKELHSASFVCMLGKKHSKVGKSLSMDQYLGFKHLVVSSRRKGLSYEDTALKRLGHKRNIALRIPYYRVAPLIVKQTDLALTIPLSLAEQYKLKTVALPFELEPLQMNLYWHKTSVNDPGIDWLKTIITDLNP
jgi:DNA-binding transcriptional LysR family regulator